MKPYREPPPIGFDNDEWLDRLLAHIDAFIVHNPGVVAECISEAGPPLETGLTTTERRHRLEAFDALLAEELLAEDPGNAWTTLFAGAAANIWNLVSQSLLEKLELDRSAREAAEEDRGEARREELLIRQHEEQSDD